MRWIFVKIHDPVPLGLALALADSLSRQFRRRHASCHRPPILGAADFEIGAQIAPIRITLLTLPAMICLVKTLRSFRINQIRPVSTNALRTTAPAAAGEDSTPNRISGLQIASSALPAGDAERHNRGHQPAPPPAKVERRAAALSAHAAGRGVTRPMFLFCSKADCKATLHKPWAQPERSRRPRRRAASGLLACDVRPPHSPLQNLTVQLISAMSCRKFAK